MSSNQALNIIALFLVGLATCSAISFVTAIVLIIAGVREFNKRRPPSRLHPR